VKFVALGDCNTGHKEKYEGPERIYHAWADVAHYELQGSILISRGHSGDKWEGMWKRWKKDVLDENPDAVVVFGGINNFTDGKSDPNPIIQKIITNMVASAKENGIVILLVSMQPFGNSKFWTKEKNMWLKTLNEWMEDFSNIQGVIFVDAYKLLEDPERMDTIRDEFDACIFREDGGAGFHLSIAGHKELGKLVAKYLNGVKNDEKHTSDCGG
jgi:lysophospholipase L1-like esterase